MARQFQKRPNVFLKEFIRGLSERRISRRSTQSFSQRSPFKPLRRHSWKSSSSVSEIGDFELWETLERVGRNPKMMGEFTITAGMKPVFRASKILKKSVNKALQERALVESDMEVNVGIH